jgi:hypothetical protein
MSQSETHESQTGGRVREVKLGCVGHTPKLQMQNQVTKRNPSSSNFCPPALLDRFEAIAKPLGFEILTYRELNVKWIKAISFRFWIGRLILARLFDKMDWEIST